MLVAIPASHHREPDDDRIARLIREGALRPGPRWEGCTRQTSLPPDVDLLKALDEERKDRL
jgi:hypothetical protein